MSSPEILFNARGGGEEVPGSCYDYTINGELVRIDCGLRPSNFNSNVRHVNINNRDLSDYLDEMLVKPEVDPLPNWDSVPKLKNLLLSHAHLDHIGAVPKLLQKYRDVTVWATKVTAEICEIQWRSTPMIAEKKMETPLFTESDVEFALSRIKIIQPGQHIQINSKLSVEPVEAGHLLGAVSFIFYWEGQPIGFHAVDLSIHNNQRSVPDAPEVRFDNLRFLTIESTRITEKNIPRHVTEKQVMETIREGYRNKMKIRIFGFAIGRSQELFALVKKTCPTAPLAIDGLARKVSKIYAEHLGGVFTGIGDYFVQDQAERTMIIESNHSNIAIVPSAMQFGGAARQYAKYGCGRKDHLFISPGYRDPRSPEFAFFESDNHNDVFAFGVFNVARMCETATFNLTSHCDGDDVLEMKERLNPEQTVLVHGEPDRIDRFMTTHSDEGFIKAKNNITISL